MRVATAVGRGAGFADAYRVGQGPTAHLLPITPGWAGLVYQILGVNSPKAEFFLASWSIGLAIGTYLVLYRAFRFLGIPRWVRLFAFACACLLPTYIPQESVDFRVWDGGLAVFISAVILNGALKISRSDKIDRRDLVILPIGAALLFFVNPTIGLGSIACLGLAYLLRTSFLDTIRASIIGVVSLFLLVLPWAIRNQAVLGSPILLRSNAGLELAIGNYPGALYSVDRGQAFMNRLEDVHPSVGNSSYIRMQSLGGEVGYSQALGDQTKRWIKDNPIDFIKLGLLHIRQTVFPQEWQFSSFGAGVGTTVRFLLSNIVGFFGVLGLLIGLKRNPRHWIYPAAIIITTILVGFPFQPVKRYTYLLYPVILFCSSQSIWWIEQQLSKILKGRRRIA